MEHSDEKFHTVTAEHIESLAEKLDVLAASMSHGERAALARVILNAATAARREGHPVHEFSGPLANSIAVGADFTKTGQSAPVAAISKAELRSKERAFFQGITRT